MPAPEVDIHLLFVLLAEPDDQVPHFLRLLPVTRIEVDRRLVPGDDHPVVEGFAEVVLKLLRVEPVLQGVGDAVVAKVDLQAPVVVHQ